jgi:hypothetical protein
MTIGRRKNMPAPKISLRKVTLSLPESLVRFADQQAGQAGINRSRFFIRVLTQAMTREQRKRAAAGYLFFAEESVDFAKTSAPATREVFGNDHPAW